MVDGSLTHQQTFPSVFFIYRFKDGCNPSLLVLGKDKLDFMSVQERFIPAWR